jgi:hypothetical protein
MNTSNLIIHKLKYTNQDRLNALSHAREYAIEHYRDFMTNEMSFIDVMNLKDITSLKEWVLSKGNATVEYNADRIEDFYNAMLNVVPFIPESNLVEPSWFRVWETVKMNCDYWHPLHLSVDASIAEIFYACNVFTEEEYLNHITKRTLKHIDYVTRNNRIHYEEIEQYWRSNIEAMNNMDIYNAVKAQEIVRRIKNSNLVIT